MMMAIMIISIDYYNVILIIIIVMIILIIIRTMDTDEFMNIPNRKREGIGARVI